ncbi:uncharacterized protein [Henckelia pumila]|uniref:uncharacterized protein isoform X1 n=1 Tax=Henckelia pumila TaxID=405737 RepID=UPI003C6EA42E
MKKSAIPFHSSRAKLLFQCPNHEIYEILETAPPYLRKKVMKVLPESKDRDWSEVDTVVKILSSDQKMIDCSDMIPPGSTLGEEIRSKRWLVYVLDGRKKESFKNSSVKRHGCISSLEQMRGKKRAVVSDDTFCTWNPS